MPAPAKQGSANWSALRAKLSAMLLEKINSGKLVLPAIPSTAARVLECLEANAHQERAAKILENDPVLALEVLRLANSASFAPRARIESISHAITMLGAARLRSLLVTASARQVFVSRNRTIRDLTAALWTHSVSVAVTARQVAVRAAFPDKEAPYMAGLMHDVGKPIVAIHLLDLERSVSRSMQDHWIDPTEWMGIIQDVHRPVGIAVAKQWNLSAEVCKAIEDCVEFDPIERMSAANAVRFANALAKREGVYPGAVDTEQVETVLLIGRSMLGLDDDAVAALAQTLRGAASSEGSSGG
ncbi:MAG TPA: HDOD domain-containing protein [Polyangiales bacterium]|nr:HDOD domain-containing protein [Polyangiales bacterium]